MYMVSKLIFFISIFTKKPIICILTYPWNPNVKNKCAMLIMWYILGFIIIDDQISMDIICNKCNSLEYVSSKLRTKA